MSQSKIKAVPTEDTAPDTLPVPQSRVPSSRHCNPEDAVACLLAVTQELNSTAELDAGLARVGELLKEYVPYSTMSVLLLDDLGRELHFAYAAGHPQEVVEHWRFGIGQGIVGTAAGEKRPIVVPDVSKDSRYIGAIDSHQVVKSEMAIPLISKDRMIGILDIGGPETEFFTPQDEKLLGFLADHLANAIEGARLYQNMRRQARTLSLLHELSRELTSILNRRQLLRKVADRIRRLIDYDVFSVMLWSEQKQLLEPWVSVFGDGLKNPKRTPVKLGEGISGASAALRQSVRVPNVHLDPRYISCVDGFDIRSELAVPLIFKGRLIGVIDLESKKYNAFSQHHQQLLSTMASTLAIALENARLYEKLRHDEQRLEQDLSTAREVQKQLLPKATPWVPGLQIGVAYEPARHLGGDFYDFLPRDDGSFAVAVGDVAGKATSAALFGSLAIGTLREFAAQNDLEPGQMLAGLNDRLGKLGFENRFVAMGLAFYDGEARRIRLANSGLPYPYVLRGDGTVEQIELGGVPLGLLGSQKYEEAAIDLEPGDALVLTSDGVEESQNEKEAEFGQKRIEDTLRGLAGKSAAEVARGLLEAIRRYTDSYEIYDDRTIVVLKAD